MDEGGICEAKVTRKCGAEGKGWFSRAAAAARGCWLVGWLVFKGQVTALLIVLTLTLILTRCSLCRQRE